jgi:hypothetical protein
MKSIVQVIKSRSARLYFVYIKPTEVGGHFKAAKCLAEAALTLSRPAVPENPDIVPMRPFTTQPLQIEKVIADIPDDSGDMVTPTPSQRPEFPASHRGRLRLHEMRKRNRKHIMEAPSAGEFRKEVKWLIDPAPNPISVTAESLKEVFERRLNPPATLPDSLMHLSTKSTT